MVASRLGRYEIRREIGRGTIGSVYLGFDSRSQRQVAIKVLPARLLQDPTFLVRFERYVWSTSDLKHPSIVPVQDYGEEGHSPYIVTKYMRGGSLQDRLAQGPVPLDKVSNIAQRVCAALDEAHSRNIVHGAIKPGNILFDQEGNAYLSDFGIGRLVESARSRQAKGAPKYMAPEQADGKAPDARSDVYQMGVVLFEMLTGRVPFDADAPAGLLYQHARGPIPSVQELNAQAPSECDAVISRAMAKRPQDRFATAGELGAALAAALRGAAETRPEIRPEIRPETRREPEREPEISRDVLERLKRGLEQEPEREPSARPEPRPEPEREPVRAPVTSPEEWEQFLHGITRQAEREPEIGPEIWERPEQELRAEPVARPEIREEPERVQEDEPEAAPAPWKALRQGLALEADAQEAGPTVGPGARQELRRQLWQDQEPAADTERRSPILWWALGGGAVLALIAVVVVGARFLLPKAAPSPTPVPATATSVPAVPVLPTWTAEPTATPVPVDTETPVPTETPAPAPTPTETPTLIPTSTPTATRRPTRAPTSVPAPLELSSPLGGTLKSPVTFTWSGTRGISYLVTLIHTVAGHTHASGWIESLSWTFDIPADQWGEWRWYVAADNDAVSSTASFLFDPGLGGGGGKKPTPTPID